MENKSPWHFSAHAASYYLPTSATVTALSYPHGSVDQRVRNAAKTAGYKMGGCSRYGLNHPDRDPLLLCRTDLTDFDSVADLTLKIEGHWDWFRFRHKDPAS